jgi:hypothetical protein
MLKDCNISNSIISKALLICFLACSSALRAQTNFSQMSDEIAKGFSTKDTLFRQPYIDIDEQRANPIPHRYIHGGFKGTGTKFSFYLPAKENYKGHFFQYITPTPDSETLSQNAQTKESDKISFSIVSGAYFIETNGGGAGAMGMPGADASITAYRANAACAEFSRTVAMKIFGGKRPYGYAFGGSGGAFRTIGSIENTKGVWDGVVPYVMPTSMSLPNSMTVANLVIRILYDKLPQIVDALEPGSKKSVYDVLETDEQKAAYDEISRMGFPPGAWKELNGSDVGAFAVIYPIVRMMDPTYFTDFWTKPGYEGYNAPQSLKDARVQITTKIIKLISAEDAMAMGLEYDPFAKEAHGLAANSWKSIIQKQGDEKYPVAAQVEEVPQVNTNAYDLTVKTGDATGKNITIQRFSKSIIVFSLGNGDVAKRLKVGDELLIDNTNYLAVQYYHRHQMPGNEFYGWQQYKDSNGNPIWAQRPQLLGPMFAAGAGGSIPGGKFQGKMILLQNMYDGGAYPWNAHWYREKIKSNLGVELNNNFRLWFSDHANHGDYPFQADPTHTVVYLGILQQALRDLSAWVEKGIVPPMSTSYIVKEGQVIIPDNARERHGIQPVVHVKVNGSERAEVKPGQKITVEAVIDVPSNAGKVVSAEWNFVGGNNFKAITNIRKYYTTQAGSKVVIKTTYTYSQVGTFFPLLRVASQREGDFATPFTRIQNLGSARVVVK